MRIHRFAALLVSCVLSACGGGNGSTSSVEQPPQVNQPAPRNQSAGGIWKSQETQNGVAVTIDLLVTEDGRFFEIGRNNTGCRGVATGSVTTSNLNQFSGSIIFALNIFDECTYEDGSTSGDGLVTGTVQERSSLSTTLYGGVTSLGNAVPTVTHHYTFDTEYLQTSSLAKVAGNWITRTGAVVSVDTNGRTFSQDPLSGCVLNGQISIIDARYNAYAVAGTYGNCHGRLAKLNGRELTGLLTVTQDRLVYGYSVKLNDDTTIIVVDEVTRT